MDESSKALYVGLDVHKDSIAVAYAPEAVSAAHGPGQAHRPGRGRYCPGDGGLRLGDRPHRPAGALTGERASSRTERRHLDHGLEPSAETRPRYRRNLRRRYEGHDPRV